jgi:hypothetical protein
MRTGIERVDSSRREDVEVMRREVVGAVVAILALLVFSGCADLFGPGEPDLRMQTDRGSYEAADLGGEGSWTTYGFEVVIRTTNAGGVTLHLSGCGPNPSTPIYGVVPIAREPETQRRSAYTPAWACTGGPPIELSPRETRTDTLRLWGPTSVDGVTGEVLGVLEGTKAVSFRVWTCPDKPDCQAPDHLGRSNPFEVRVAPEK